MQRVNNQRGLALLMLVFVLALAITAYTLKTLTDSGVTNERDKKTTKVLVEAKNALLGSVVGRPSIDARPYFPNPSLALVADSEGKESLAPLGGAADISLIGKYPWHSLKTKAYKDGWEECLWYVVSGRYKNSPPTAVFNWDTQGQLDVIDSGGNVIASNLVALIIAPGPALDGQNRSLASADYTQCGGNDDARNYLDAFDSDNAIAGQLNYFSGSTNNRVAPDESNKVFILEGDNHFNDQFIFVTVDDVFNPIIKRRDFKNQIDSALSDSDFHDYLIDNGVSINKGTENIVCSDLGAYEEFCNNWVEMFLFTALPSPHPVTIDGATSSTCTHVLLFGGKKINMQDRSDGGKKRTPSNYIEGANVAAFDTPVANNSNFVGVSAFDPENPDRDVLKCL